MENISNSYEERVARRKREFDIVEEGRQTRVGDRHSSKKGKTSDSFEDTSNKPFRLDVPSDYRDPHEYLAGDWRFAENEEDQLLDDTYAEENVPFIEPVDVERVLSILYQALNEHCGLNNLDNNESANRTKNKKSSISHSHRFTSPLSGSPDRVPFVRRTVGGSSRGKVEQGLQKWVLRRNHYNDVCTTHPSRRSAEWIEALHEMGWECLHPTYVSQCQQTFQTCSAFSTSSGDRASTREVESARSEGLDEKEGWYPYQVQDSDGNIHRRTWDTKYQVHCLSSLVAV